MLNDSALIWGHIYEQMDEIGILSAFEGVIRNSAEDRSSHILFDCECSQRNWKHRILQNTAACIVSFIASEMIGISNRMFKKCITRTFGI